MARVFFYLLLSCGVAWGCPKPGGEGEEAGVAQVATWLKTGEATPVDVNTEEVRGEYGLLPGAVLLATSSGYEADLLPADKSRKLVFYCFNRLCTASHLAAKRAKGFGHTQVYVMSEGIKAWKEAGLVVEAASP